MSLARRPRLLLRPVRSRPAQILRSSLGIVLVVGTGVAVRSQSVPSRGFTVERAAHQYALEQKLRAVPDPARIAEHVKKMSAEPHMAGTPASRAVAEYALARLREAGVDAWIEEHQALMPHPRERRVEIVAPAPVRLALAEPPLAEDPSSATSGQVPTFNAYGADGDVTGEVVYVNYGTPEDFARLATEGVDVKGRIVLARYGQTWRGIKPKLAQERGAIGCLIYSDPRDDGFWRGVVYPDGAWRPDTGVQRGSVLDMPLYPGDPLTPGWGAEAGGRQLDRGEAATLLKIPVLPISHGDTLPILKGLAGKVAPEGWRGALPVTYRLGPGPVRVRLVVASDWQVRPLHNVLARIPGTRWPDEWVIYGNHHDAWVHGASDPASGAAALLETARALGEMRRQGWSPSRTILFALWDGEEFGLLGSTEWAEKHAAELREKAVLYVNTDATGRGWLRAGGSHSLEALVNEVAGDLADPASGRTLRDEARERAAAQQGGGETPPGAPAGLRLSALGSGSDYTAFLDHLAVASLNLGFGGESEGGVYHSIYDSFAWYTRFSDTDFTDGAMLARTIATLLSRVSEAAVLPFQFVDTAATVARYAGEVEQLWRNAPEAPALDLAPLWVSIGRLRRAAEQYETAHADVPRLTDAVLRTREADLAAVNRLLRSAERVWAHDEGLPGRPWFRHLLYAPGLYTGYGVKTLPGIREAIEGARWDEAAQHVKIAGAAIDRLAAHLDEAAGRLRALTGR